MIKTLKANSMFNKKNKKFLVNNKKMRDLLIILKQLKNIPRNKKSINLRKKEKRNNISVLLNYQRVIKQKNNNFAIKNSNQAPIC